MQTQVISRTVSEIKNTLTKCKLLGSSEDKKIQSVYKLERIAVTSFNVGSLIWIYSTTFTKLLFIELLQCGCLRNSLLLVLLCCFLFLSSSPAMWWTLSRAEWNIFIQLKKLHVPTVSLSRVSRLWTWRSPVTVEKFPNLRSMIFAASWINLWCFLWNLFLNKILKFVFIEKFVDSEFSKLTFNEIPS